MATPIQNVALLGADGTLGPAILQALHADSFQITVLKRASSSTPDKYPSGVKITRIGDDFTISDLLPALQGQDAVIACIKGHQTALQTRLAEACAQAGVRRFIPADFGSCDSASPRTQALVPLYKRKTEVRESLQDLAKINEAFSWTAIVCAHFLDWNMEFLHMDLAARKAEILDDGDVKWSASTLGRVGEATARVLENLDATKNKAVYVQSVCITQMEFVEAFERATGEKWEVIRRDSEVYEKEEKAKADAGDKEAVENLVWLLGALDANWEGKEGFAMEMLGLENEDLDAVVKRIIEENR